MQNLEINHGKQAGPKQKRRDVTGLQIALLMHEKKALTATWSEHIVLIRKRIKAIYTEKLPGVAAHDSLFVLLRPGVAVHERRITRRNNTNKESCAATPRNSSV